jgi:hypothetical protein
MFGVDLNFKDSSLDEMKLYGMAQEIVYKDTDERDEKVGKVWEKFLSSQGFSSLKEAQNIYVIYSDYKKDSLNCFIGVDSKEPVSGFAPRIIGKSNYFFSTLNYSPKIKLKEIWKEIDSKKLKRNFKRDIEVYSISDLPKTEYKIKVYLSKK